MATVTVLDPTAPPKHDSEGAGPDAGPLHGKVVGIRYDMTWRSFLWVMDEWGRALTDDGAEVRTWCAGPRVGEGAEKTATELDGFATDVDLAVVGLGN